MRRDLSRKWRPPLAFVLGGTLAAVLLLPVIGIGYFRVAGNILGWGETAGVIALAAVLATLVLTYLLWRLVLRPVRALTGYAASVASGAAAAVEPEHFGTPEFLALGQSVFEMGRVLQGREAVLRSYADHVTHELRSPLTVIRGATELLDSDAVSPADRQRLLTRIGQATDRMATLLEAQRALARAQEPFADGACTLGDLLPSLQRSFPRLRIAGQGDADIPLPPEAMRIALDHLAGNAVAHGATELSLTVTDAALTIADNGTGISTGNRDRIFDPFFTTRRDSGGTGMGLPIVRRMLAAHEASITLLDTPGTVFEIRFG